MSDVPQGAVAPLPVASDRAPSSATFWLCAATLWRRELRGFYRQRSRILGTLSTPLLFWFVLGSGFGSSLLGAEGSYGQFFFPGTMALSVLFTSIFANISLIEDRREGFLLGVLVAPVSRLALVLGKVCGATTLGAIQAALLLPLAPLAGISLDLGALPMVFAVLLLMAFGLTGSGIFLRLVAEFRAGLPLDHESSAGADVADVWRRLPAGRLFRMGPLADRDQPLGIRRSRAAQAVWRARSRHGARP